MIEIDSGYRLIFNVISLTSKYTHAVLQADTGRIICLTNWLETAKAMESEENTRVWYFINNSRKIPRAINVNIPCEYVFDNITSSFYKKSISDEEIAKCLILSEKSAVFDIIHRTINKERVHIRPALAMQEPIYQLKLEEAKDLLSGNTFDPSRHPYTHNYALLKSITPIVAAQRIINKNNFAKARLFETEVLRMKYVTMLKSCKDLLQINEICNEFSRETNIYGRL
jgi:hypothetical protein